MNSTWYLLLLNLGQFLLIFVLLYHINHLHSKAPNEQLQSLPTPAVSLPPPRCDPVVPAVKAAAPGSPCTWQGLKKPAGVAVTLMLHTPTWFQRRYTMMIQNVHQNIPDDWVIQVFYTGEGQSLKGLLINSWIQNLVDNGRVRLTVFPEELFRLKKRKIELLTDEWMWQNMLADKVLLFGGTAVICSNSPRRITDFTKFDYIGAPWGQFKGFGGEGGISIRSRKVMLDVIRYELSKHGTPEAKAQAYKKWGQEDSFFVSRMVEMKRAEVGGASSYKLSSKNESMSFAAIGGTYNNDVWAVSGILGDVPFAERDKFLTLCPEIKMFYPSLHDPGCFGASPDAEQCAASICALKPKTERRGGC